MEKQVELLVHLQNENTDDEEDYVHQCTFCYKSFKTKKSMTRHINKGRCKLVHDNISIYERELNIDPPDIQSLTCRFCKTNYGKSSSYSRHLKNGCKAKKIYEAQLEKRVLIARNKAASVIQNQTINNTTNNTININMPPMRAFGDENTDYITVKLLINELKKCNNMNDMSTVVGNFTKMIHANPKHPENHNVQLRSLNGGYARVYNGTSFEDRHAIEVQDKILQTIGKFITTKVETNGDEVERELPHTKIEKALESLDEDILSNADNGAGINSRGYAKYRANVKSTLHNCKTTINSTQKIYDDTEETELLENQEVSTH